MEISENVENNKHQRNSGVLHSTQSQPILLDCEENTQENKDKSAQKRSSKRRVSFASSSQLTQFLEPLNPFESFAVPVTSAEELSNVYKRSCDKHKTQPIPAIIEHLESLNFEKLSNDRADALNLKQTTLTYDSCEALEELFKRVKYRTIDLTSCSLDDISATSLFDMIEYYEACNELNISENTNIKNRGLLACINMIKRSQALHSLSTRGTIISDSNASSLGNALLSSYIYTLKLEHAQLSGRPILCLSGALQKNRVLKELCLANNELTPNDAFHIGNILKNNYHLQLLDISNNDIQNEGFRHLAEALSYQSVHVSKTSSADSLSSSSINKFDFNDFTANLNNINNNRNRFSPTPPPLQNNKNNNNKSRNENSSIISVNNNNNNSILPVCDSDKSNDSTGRNEDEKQQQQQKNKEQSESAKIKIGVEPSISSEGGSSTTTIAITSTNVIDDAKSSANNSNRKFKYTSESLSPISHGYDDSTGTHTLFSSHSPERSFSSESLCSTESVESNDSKSSIRLIESKFSNRNGTLERQSYNHYSSSAVQDSADKKLTGLQVLILWNNNLSSACAPSTADLFECTEYLQIINFGQNYIGNEFLVSIKSSLKLNESIISLGMQATNITCDGLKVLAEVIEFGGNTTLQRIDLRNNNLSLTGLSTLSEALNSNKTITRIDLDDAPKNEMLPVNAEFQRLISTIRHQCSINENPPEQQQPSEQKPSSTATSTNKSRTKKPHFTSRKISLTVIPSGVKIVPKQQLLEPIKKQTINRSPSPILSPSSPLTSPSRSPSRSRFQVSRVSESSSSGIGSKSPSSSSSSPTFFPSSTSLSSRFRVIAVNEIPKKSDINNQPITPLKVSEQQKSENIMTMTRKEIDISTIPPSIKPIFNIHSIASSQSDDQLDYEEKRFIDLDSCSSFSSSIDSIDRQTDISSTDSFDLVEKTPADINDKTINNNDEVSEDKKDIFSNENTLTVSTSSSSSNEGLTLTTNSPAELSPKQEPHKRTRKTSWIHSAISGSSNKNNTNNENTSASSYPATLDKLLNLFHHPSSIFSKTSPDSSLKASNEDHSPSQQLLPPQKSSGMGQKENSISGFLQSLVSLTHNKKEEKSPQESTILQNISPENTIGKNASNSQMVLESLPKSIKKELKENISPENTISSENLVGIEKQQRGLSKVVFVVGEDSSLDFSETSFDESSHSAMLKPNDPKNDDLSFESHPHSLGDIARDSLAVFKSTNDQQDES